MTTIQIFEPPMCCPTGVCGPAVDPVLVRFSADFHWLADQGVRVERYNLSQHPFAFAGIDLLRNALEEYGNECLPLVVVNGAIVSRGRYPTRDELARFAGVVADAASLRVVQPSCCSTKKGRC